jgi:hypothetical protein
MIMDPSAKTPRPRRLVRWVFRALVLLIGVPAVTLAALVLLLLTQPQGKSRFAANDEGPLATTPDQLIVISRGTTRILGPLRADGYVDYVAALNQLTGAEVVPKENGAVKFWQAWGPEPILGPPGAVRFFDLLGMAVPSREGDYFLMPEAFTRRLLPQNGSNPNPDLASKVWEQFEKAQQAPWPGSSAPN